MPLKKQPNVEFQKYPEAMSVVAKLRKLGIPVRDIREIEIGSLVATDDGVSGISVEREDFEPDDALHQYTAVVWDVRQQLGLVGSALKGDYGSLLRLAESCLKDTSRAAAVIAELPVVRAAVDAALAAAL